MEDFIKFTSTHTPKTTGQRSGEALSQLVVETQTEAVKQRLTGRLWYNQLALTDIVMSSRHSYKHR